LAEGAEELIGRLPPSLMNEPAIRNALIVLGSAAPGEATSHEDLRAEWGEQYEENTAHAREAAQFLFAERPELLDKINERGYGNDTRLIMALVALGKHLSQEIEL
jgi:hypothetical protein